LEGKEMIFKGFEEVLEVISQGHQGGKERHGGYLLYFRVYGTLTASNKTTAKAQTPGVKKMFFPKPKWEGTNCNVESRVRRRFRVKEGQRKRDGVAFRGSSLLVFSFIVVFTRVRADAK
jgi:hypothetical protein